MDHAHPLFWASLHLPSHPYFPLLSLGPSFTLAQRSVCKVKTQEAENFDEEVKSLVSAWRMNVPAYGSDTKDGPAKSWQTKDDTKENDS